MMRFIFSVMALSFGVAIVIPILFYVVAIWSGKWWPSDVVFSSDPPLYSS